VTPLSPTENTDDKIDIDTFSENTRELKFVKSAFFVWAAKNQNISAFVIAFSRFIIAFASVVTEFYFDSANYWQLSAMISLTTK
jgi:hypothetical protein